MDRPNLREARLGSNSRPSGAFAFRQDQRGGGFGASERYGYGGGYYGYGGGYRRRDFDYPGGGLDKVTQKVVAFGGLTRAVGWSADGVGQAGGAIRGIPDTYNGAYQQRRAYGEYSERVADRYDDRGQSRGYAPQGGGYAQGGGSQQTSFDRTDPRYYDYDGDGNLGRGDEFKDFARANPELAARYSGNGRKLDRNEFAQLLLDRERFLAERPSQQAGQGAAQSSAPADVPPPPIFKGDAAFNINLTDRTTNDPAVIEKVLKGDAVTFSGGAMTPGQRVQFVLESAREALRAGDASLYEALSKNPELGKKFAELFADSTPAERVANQTLAVSMLEEVRAKAVADKKSPAEIKAIDDAIAAASTTLDQLKRDVEKNRIPPQRESLQQGSDLWTTIIEFIKGLFAMITGKEIGETVTKEEPAASASAAAPAAAPAKAPEPEQPKDVPLTAADAALFKALKLAESDKQITGAEISAAETKYGLTVDGVLDQVLIERIRAEAKAAGISAPAPASGEQSPAAAPAAPATVETGKTP